MRDFTPVIIAIGVAAFLAITAPVGGGHDLDDTMWHVHSSGVAHTYCVDGNLIAVVARTGETIDHQERCD